VKVHATQDREHDYQDSLHSVEAVHIPHELCFHHPLTTRKSPSVMYTLPIVYDQEITIRHFNGLI
jgi:hypothetical protein